MKSLTLSSSLQYLETLLSTLRKLYEYLQQTDYNEEIGKIQRAQYEKALKQFEKFRGTIQNEEEFKKLSTPEQQALYKNTRNYEEVLQTLMKELNMLDTTRLTYPILNVGDEITKSIMLLDKALNILGGPSGKLVYPKLVNTNDKRFKKVNYQRKLSSLEIEIDEVVHSLREYLPNPLIGDSDNLNIEVLETVILIRQTYTSLSLAQAWLINENDRVENEGMPKAREIKLPDLVKPELPKEQKDQPEE